MVTQQQHLSCKWSCQSNGKLNHNNLQQSCPSSHINHLFHTSGAAYPMGMGAYFEYCNVHLQWEQNTKQAQMHSSIHAHCIYIYMCMCVNNMECLHIYVLTPSASVRMPPLTLKTKACSSDATATETRKNDKECMNCNATTTPLNYASYGPKQHAQSKWQVHFRPHKALTTLVGYAL